MGDFSDFDIDLDAIPLRAAMEEARRADAIQYAVSMLRQGKGSSDEFQRLVADLLEGKKLKRKILRHWIAIGQDYAELYVPGEVTHEEVLAQLARKYGFGETTIRDAVKLYKEGCAAGGQKNKRVKKNKRGRQKTT